MSKLWRGVKKVFRKVGKFVRKYWKPILIATVIYFSAGVALSAMPSTATFASSMPGFGTGAIFSKAAVAIGFEGAAGSGIAGTIAANAAAAAGSAAAVGAGSAAAGGSGLGVAGGAGFAMPGGELAASQALAGGAVAGSTSLAVPAIAKTTSLVAGLSGLEKIALASTVFKGIGGLLSPTQDDINRKAHARNFGQSFGIGRDGTGPGWQGLAKNAFAGRFSGDSQSTPFSTPATPTQSLEASQPMQRREASQPMQGQDYSPFSPTGDPVSNPPAQGDYINQGYRQKNYSPV